MPKIDKRVDEYIAKAPEYAKPILKHLRTIIHSACSDCEENIKWGFPHFDCYGSNICGIACFKNHAAFGFWKYRLMSDPYKILHEVGDTSMGNLGKIKSLADLPSDEILIEYIKEAAQLNKDGVKNPSKVRSQEKKEIETPDYFLKELKKNKALLEIFTKASYSFRKEYIMWFEEAKTDATRQKRIETALEWIAEGKGRNWKYETKK